jgi:hypothetical protein
MPFQTFAHGGAICLAMERLSDDGGVVIQRPNQRMFFQEGKRLLPGSLTTHQLPNRPQPPAAV